MIYPVLGDATNAELSRVSESKFLTLRPTLPQAESPKDKLPFSTKFSLMKKYDLRKRTLTIFKMKLRQL